MDSLTQLVLGAGVGAAVLGKPLGPRRAAVLGGILGTLPDLDVFFPFDDPVESFVLHRGATHSLIVHAVVTPLIAEPLVRFVKPLKGERLRVYAAVFLCFATHALLDAMTIYGTRLFWPVWPEPLGAGSIFIIDPLYTLPLLVAFVWALCLKAWTPRFRTGLATCLLLSSVYLGWTLVAQRIVTERADAHLAQAGIAHERVLATPLPFSTVVWRAIALDGVRYHNLYLPIMTPGEAPVIHSHPSGANLAGCLSRIEAAATLAAFTKGFYSLELLRDTLVVSDLRMGLTPNYVFRFAVAELRDGTYREIAPRRVEGPRQADGDLDWLLATLAGSAIPRPAEAAILTASGEVTGEGTLEQAPKAC